MAVKNRKKKMCRLISILLIVFTVVCSIPGVTNLTYAEEVWTRLYGNNRYDTMKAIVNGGFSKTGGTVVVATGAGFKDALAAAGLAGIHDAPVVLTDGKALSKQAKDVLTKLKPKTVYVAGGTAAISDSVYNQIKSTSKASIKRLAGNTSSGTSAKLALEGKGKWKENIAIIATNKTFKDALSVAPIAFAKKYPVLLADNGKSLSKDVLNTLKSINIRKVIIVGGIFAVTTNVESQLKSAGIEIKERLAGQTAPETSARIAEWGIQNGLSVNKMGVATSKNYPDALAGAAFCGHNKSVLVLADDDTTMNTSFAEKFGCKINKGYVFGGEAAVGKKTLELLIKKHQERNHMWEPVTETIHHDAETKTVYVDPETNVEYEKDNGFKAAKTYTCMLCRHELTVWYDGEYVKGYDYDHEEISGRRDGGKSDTFDVYRDGIKIRTSEAMAAEFVEHLKSHGLDDNLDTPDYVVEYWPSISVERIKKTITVKEAFDDIIVTGERCALCGESKAIDIDKCETINGHRWEDVKETIHHDEVTGNERRGKTTRKLGAPGWIRSDHWIKDEHVLCKCNTCEWEKEIISRMIYTREKQHHYDEDTVFPLGVCFKGWSMRSSDLDALMSHLKSHGFNFNEEGLLLSPQGKIVRNEIGHTEDDYFGYKLLDMTHMEQEIVYFNDTVVEEGRDEKITVRKAFDETVTTGKKCVLCGKIKALSIEECEERGHSWDYILDTVHHEAETIVDHFDAETELVWVESSEPREYYVEKCTMCDREFKRYEGEQGVLFAYVSLPEGSMQYTTMYTQEMVNHADRHGFYDIDYLVEQSGRDPSYFDVGIPIHKSTFGVLWNKSGTEDGYFETRVIYDAYDEVTEKEAWDELIIKEKKCAVCGTVKKEDRHDNI